MPQQPLVVVTATRVAAPATATPTVTPNPSSPTLDPLIPRPFTWPVAGACLPQSEALIPNAPRTYRNGVHEGLDFYPGSSCAQVKFGTPVVAMYEGTVVRADLEYRDITAQQVRDLAALTAAQGFSDPATLDIYRGRQVWVDHGNGVVTRYCHLSSIATGIRAGVRVRAGDVLGGVGESGTPEFITAPGTEMHLHAEVRIGDSFLGAGLPPDVVRGLYSQLFGLTR
jgi:murein DD-endopeptidase MepM/ murein hydrolase activator NlpD